MKKFKDYDPVMDEHGIEYVAAAGTAGIGVQGKTWAMVTGGVFVFADNALANMADTTYQVIVQNQTDIADPATVGSKTATQFTITGPDDADVLDIVVIGRIAGQQV